MARPRRTPVAPPVNHTPAVAGVLLACLSVVAFLPGGLSRWTWPKLLVMVVAVAVTLFAPRSGRLPRWAWWVAGASVAVLAVSAVVSGELAGLWGRWPRYTGPLVAVPVGIGAVWLGAVLLGASAPERVRRAFRGGLAIAALLVAGVALLETLGLRPIASDLARPGSLLGNASDQAVAGLMIAGVLFAQVVGGAGRRDRQWWLMVAGLVAGLAAVTLSASRAGYVGLLITLLVAAVLVLLARRRGSSTPSAPGRLWAWLGGAVGAVAILVVMNPESLRRLFVGSGLADRRGDRWAIWSATAEVIGQAPWLGTGAGGFIDAVPRFLSARWFQLNDAGATLESPHNWLLEVLTDGGLALLAVVLTGLVLVARVSWRRGVTAGSGGDWLVPGSVAALVGAMASLSLYFVNAGVLLLGGVLVGSLIAVPVEPRASVGDPDPPAWRRIVQRVAVAGWAAALLVAAIAEYPLAQGVRGDPGAADSAFEVAQSLRPWDADIASIAAQALAQAATQTADPLVTRAAVDWGELAVDGLPRSVAALEAWAVALEAAGDFPAAVQARARMVDAVPHDPSARLNLAVTLALAGRAEEAIAQARVALELDPALAQAEDLVVRLCMDLTIPSCHP